MAEPDVLVGHIVRLEEDFGLPSGFLVNLPQESDWSFTIKAHSLVEAVVTQTVVMAVGEPRLNDLVGSLPLLGRHSKIAYADALGLLSKQQSDFIKRLSKIRNDLVHKLEALGFTYPNYVAALSVTDRNNTLSELLFLAGGVGGKAGALFQANPRLAVWVHVMAVVTFLLGQKAKAALNATIRGHYKKVAEEILGPLKELE